MTLLHFMYCFFSHHKINARNTTQNRMYLKVFTLVWISCVFWDVMQHNWLFGSQCFKSALWSHPEHYTTTLPQNGHEPTAQWHSVTSQKNWYLTQNPVCLWWLWGVTFEDLTTLMIVRSDIWRPHDIAQGIP